MGHVLALRAVDRVALSFGSLKITWYGICVVTGMVIGLWTAGRRGWRDRIAPEAIVDLGLWLILGGIVGARAWYVIAYWEEEFARRPLWEMLATFHGGLVFHGGLLGASLATVFYARKRKLPLWKLADTLAPSIALGHVFGRIGCFVNGCCYGSACALPWAVHYADLPADAPGTGLHPSQLYEACLNLVLYLALARQYRNKRFDGEVFSFYLGGYGVVRFAVEFFRGDYTVRYLGGWATPGQLASLVVLAAGVALWFSLRGMAREDVR